MIVDLFCVYLLEKSEYIFYTPCNEINDVHNYLYICILYKTIKLLIQEWIEIAQVMTRPNHC